MAKNKIMECFCCKKEIKESEGKWFFATSSGKCRDGTDAERRFVCKDCHMLKKE